MAHRDKFGRPTFGRKWVRRDGAEFAPPKLPVTLPLGLRRSEKNFAIMDGAGRVVASVGYEDDPVFRAESRSFSEDEAREVAQMIARLLTDVESDKPAAAASIIPLDELNAENDE